MLTTRCRSSQFTANPLPDLTTLLAACVNDEMFVCATPYLILDLPTHSVGRQLATVGSLMKIDDHATFLSDRPKPVARRVDCHMQVRRDVVVPAQLIEDRREVEALKRRPKRRTGWWHC